MSWRSSGRPDRRARDRSRRARSHLERVRARNQRRRPDARARAGRDARPRGSSPAPRWARPAVLAAVPIAAFVLGVFAAGPALGRLADVAGGRADRVHGIAVQGAVRLAPEEVARATGVTPGEGLDEVTAEAVAGRLREHPWIAEASALSLPNGQLLVRVRERVPRAVLAPEAGSKGGADPDGVAWWVDAEGRPFAPVDSEATAPGAPEGDGEVGPAGDGLPRLESAATLERGRAHALLREAISLAERANSAWLRLPVEGSADGWVVRPRDRDVEVILGWSQLPERIERLEWLLRSPEVAGAGLERIDLRFADRAVLR